MNIAFVLLTFGIDEPAGIEYSIAALAQGCGRLGHRASILTSASARGKREDLVRLRSLRLPRPATEEDLLKALRDPGPVCDDVARTLEELRADVVCWADASWGLGYLSPAPSGVRRVLRVGVLRTDELMHRALAHRPDAVFTCSDDLTRSAVRAGLDTSAWRSVPDPLHLREVPPGNAERERLRTRGPVRIAARAEPHKGIAEFIAACPKDWHRPVEIALAPAAFEYWPGMQRAVINECRHRAERTGTVHIVPPLPWDDVPAFFAGAAATVNCSTSPETFGIAAAQSLGAGTPVAHYGLGHLPSLIAGAGPRVPLDNGPRRLWEELDVFLADAERYHRAAEEAPHRVTGLTPQESAARFLALLG